MPGVLAASLGRASLARAAERAGGGAFAGRAGVATATALVAGVGSPGSWAAGARGAGSATIAIAGAAPVGVAGVAGVAAAVVVGRERTTTNDVTPTIATNASASAGATIRCLLGRVCSSLSAGANVTGGANSGA